VQRTAVWALSSLRPGEDFWSLAREHASESDPQVLVEWVSG
jgi:hypothetical protein